MEAGQMGQGGSVGREVLPIPDRPQVGLVTYDAKDPATKFPPIEPLRPPAGAPNVLVVLIDDCGFGASSAFGGRSTPRPPSGWPPVA
jgi:arylsulfatase